MVHNGTGHGEIVFVVVVCSVFVFLVNNNTFSKLEYISIKIQSIRVTVITVSFNCYCIGNHLA